MPISSTPVVHKITITDVSNKVSVTSNNVTIAPAETVVNLTLANDVVKIVSVGIAGPQGAQGLTGPQGVAGPQGVQGIAGTAGQSLVSWFTDVTSVGVVGSKVYDPNTIPSNIVINEATTDTDLVTIHVIMLGSANILYTPSIDVDGVTVTNFVEDPQTKRYYTGSVNLSFPITRTIDITETGTTNVIDSMTITRAAAGPAIQSLTIGSLPIGQTEVKFGDIVPITGSVENLATTVTAINSGIISTNQSLTVGAIDSAGIGFKRITGNVTIGNRIGALNLTANATNSFGTTGSNFVSSNAITLNQTYPTITLNTIQYPNTQSALKNSETAIVDVSVVNFDSVSYSSTNVLIPAATTYAQQKTVTRTSGSYINSGTNYTVSATKSSNNATTTNSYLIAIANIAPTATIAISGNPTNLTSSPTGTSYSVIITPNQSIVGSPSVNASIGTLTGTNLVISDTDPKGVGVFSGLSITGLSGLVGSTITSGSNYNVSGFSFRTLTMPAFSQIVAIGTTVGNINNIVANYAGGNTLTLFNDVGNHVNGFTIVNSAGVYNANGTHFWLSDAAFAGSNSSGTLQIEIRET